MSDDPHRIEQLAADEFQAHDALLGIVRQILLEQEQIVRLPDRGIGREDRLELRERVDDVDAGAAAPLVGFEDRRPTNLVGVCAQCVDVVERDRPRRIDVERAKQRGLSTLAQLEREHVGPVQHSRALPLEGSHIRERQRDRASVAADVGARTGLVEIQPGARRIDVAERRAFQIKRRIGDAAPLECREQRLLPFGVLMEDDEIHSSLS